MNLEDAFDMQPFQHEDEIIDNSHILDDLEYAKKNTRDLIDNSLRLIPFAARMVKESESPRSIEVYANLIKTTSELNKDLISLLPKPDKKEEVRSITNQQNNFMISTEDLFSKLKDIPVPELIIKEN